MKKYIAILISIFFIGCGGGGGSSSILNYELEKLSTTVVFPITPIELQLTIVTILGA